MDPDLESVFFTGVRDRTPAGILRPRTFSEVAAYLAENSEPITVIGGGHGPRSVLDGVPCLDLRSIPAHRHYDGSRITINGSALVGDVLAADPIGRAIVPVGLARTPGIGLLTTGGIGALSRSHGLSIDSLTKVSLLLGDGSPLTITPDHELWWAVRGAATRFGVVTALEFAATIVPAVTQTQLTTGATALLAWAEQAPLMPEHTSVSWLMAPGLDHGQPVVLLDEVSLGDRALRQAQCWATEVHLERTRTHPYREMAEFTITAPGLVAEQPADARSRITAVFVSAASMVQLIPDLIAHLDHAPTQWCQLSAQQMGGVVGRIRDSDSAFFGRSAEYMLMGTGRWLPGTEQEQPAREWISNLEDLLAPHILARYATEALPDEPRPMLRQTYGPQLERLAALARTYDPTGRFRYAPPF